MASYVVIRHGSNAANQTMTPRLACGLVEAKNRDEAMVTVRAQHTCYNNQTFELIPASHARKSDLQEAWASQQEADDNAAVNAEIFDEVQNSIHHQQAREAAQSLAEGNY